MTDLAAAPASLPLGGWTDEAIEQLKDLHAKGMPFTLIGLQMNRSRNSVIGKALRLGLPQRIASPRPKPPINAKRSTRPHSTFAFPNARPPRVEPVDGRTVVKKLRPPQPKPEAATDLPPEPLPATRVSIFELTDRTCRWPIGDTQSPGFCYCGGPPIKDSSYCGHHARMAYSRGAA